MLRIHKEQMVALARVALEDFVDRVREHLRETFPQRTAETSDDDLDALTRAALARGPRYGLETEHEISRFAELLVELGPAFDDGAEARAQLLDPDPDLDSDARLDAVLALPRPLHREPPALEIAS